VAQTSSGDSVVKVKREVPAQPFVIETGDATLKTWLDALCAADGGFASDLHSTADSQALWAAHVLDTGGENPGSAYIVSAETHKRVQAGRY